jgi:ADP-ribosylglycohydrolase
VAGIEERMGEAGLLYQHRGLNHRRARGSTCLAALRERTPESGVACNESKGCGGVMRAAPAGLFAWCQQDRHQPYEAFRLGVDAIPPEWLEPLELREVITEIAGDLYDFRDWEIGKYSGDRALNERIWRKYPSH